MTPGERPLRAALVPLAHALADETTREIVVNRPGEYGVERAGSWSWHDEPALTFDRLETIGILAASMSAQDVDDKHPLCAATLPDGQRIQICRPSATRPGVVALAIRKPSRCARSVEDSDFAPLFGLANEAKPCRSNTDEYLIALKRAGDWRGFFKAAASARKTIGVTGATGSGKTDLARRIVREFPPCDRLVTIEDAAEFGAMQQRNTVGLFYSASGGGMGGVAAEDCLKAALRMRPDRILMQEVRGAEAFAFLRGLAAGHPGSITTWHAEEGQSLDALEIMVKMHDAGKAIPDDRLKAYLRAYIDIIVWCARGEDGFSVPHVWLKAEHPAC